MSTANTHEESVVSFDVLIAEFLGNAKIQSESDEYENSSEEQYNSEESLHDNKSADNNDVCAPSLLVSHNADPQTA